MKWIVLNNGALINLEQTTSIFTVREPAVVKVLYYDNTDTPVAETFPTLAEANARLEELKKILVEEK